MHNNCPDCHNVMEIALGLAAMGAYPCEACTDRCDHERQQLCKAWKLFEKKIVENDIKQG